MDWKLILKLSLFGAFMGIATVFVIPSNVEPFCWLPIFIVCAIVIARTRKEGRFLHGLAVGLLNSVWITTLHVALAGRYLASHPKEAEIMKSLPSPLVMMMMMGPMVGVVSGLIIGLLAVIAGRLMKPAVRPQSTD